MENNIENGKIVHRLLLTINTVAVVIYAGLVGIMLLFASDSFFGFRGTADSFTWFIAITTFLIGLFSVIYSFKSKASYTLKSYVELITLIILLIPYLYTTGLLGL
jgi:formate hydrogenlyase subunit 3/multisubunit Na+/H+ antiporter MnhD subunit